jgi:hypothetical protein
MPANLSRAQRQRPAEPRHSGRIVGVRVLDRCHTTAISFMGKGVTEISYNFSSKSWRIFFVHSDSMRQKRATAAASSACVSLTDVTTAISFIGNGGKRTLLES